MKKYGWGILGPGSIARRFLNDLPRCEQATLAAVRSRSAERGAAFASEYNFAASYSEMTDFLADPAVDIVYMATPHPLHLDLTLQCLEAGKAVLCEKPITVNAAECQEMIGCARQQKQFLMEGMWTRFFPVNRKIKQILDSGALGQITLMQIDFGFGRWSGGKVSNPQARLFAPGLAGGSLLDVGVYCVSYAAFLKGENPVAVTSQATMVETGVDGMCSSLLKYADGAQAMLISSIVQQTRQLAVIYCEKGRIEVPDFWHPSQAAVYYTDADREDEIIHYPFDQDGASGFHFEAETVMDCLDRGLVESPEMTWAQSQAVMETLDEIRSCIGLRYPFE